MTSPMRAGVLACPMCHVPMVGAGQGDEAAICPNCSAVWVSGQAHSLEHALQAVAQWPESASATMEYAETMAAGMVCPACMNPVEAQERELVSVIQCTHCKGALVPGLVAQRIGNAEPRRRTLACPLCDRAMWPLEIAGSTEVLDVCPKCSSAWFEWNDGGLEQTLQGAQGWPSASAWLAPPFSDEVVGRLRCPACALPLAPSAGLVASVRCDGCWDELVPGAVAVRIRRS